MPIKPCKDHLGNDFKSKIDMCRYWNITESAFNARIRKGMTLEEILTTPVIDLKVKDHLGNEFKDKTEMCKYYNINRSQFTGRIRMGWSLEEALTKPTIDLTVKDH